MSGADETAAGIARLVRSLHEARSSLAGRRVSVEEVQSAVRSARAGVEAAAVVARWEARQYGWQPDAAAPAGQPDAATPARTLRCEHQAQAEAVAYSDKTNSESSGGDSEADAAQRQFWQQREAQLSSGDSSTALHPIHLLLEQLREQRDVHCDPEGDAGETAPTAAGPQARDEPGCQPEDDTGETPPTAGAQARDDPGRQPEEETGEQSTTAQQIRTAWMRELANRVQEQWATGGTVMFRTSARIDERRAAGGTTMNPEDTLQEAPRCNRTCIFCTVERCGRRRGHNAHHNCESMRCLAAEEISIDVSSKKERVESRPSVMSQTASSQDPAPLADDHAFFDGYHVPPCLGVSPTGRKLKDRMLSSAWERLTEVDVSPWYEPLTPYELMKQERLMGLRGPKSDNCGFCDQTAATFKCTTCWLTYYCGERCQNQHWKHHKVHCVAPACQVEEHDAVAVPDYQCFQLYKAYACQAVDQDYGGPKIVLLGETSFVYRFGKANLLRTCKNLAHRGKPTLLYIKVVTEKSTLPQETL